MHWLFLHWANIAGKHGCARKRTWQLLQNNPAQEESNHVIMHTHVAWVKIKPYSSLAASRAPASVHQQIWQPFSGNQERCHRFHAVPKSGCLETPARLRCSATRLSFPTDHTICPGAGGLERWMGAWARRGPTPHPRPPALRPSRKRDAFAESPSVLLIFWGVINRIKAFCRNKRDVLQRRRGDQRTSPLTCTVWLLEGPGVLLALPGKEAYTPRTT